MNVDKSKLKSFVSDKRQFRNSGARNLALLLLNQGLTRIDEAETRESESESESESELSEPVVKPVLEPVVEPVLEPVVEPMIVTEREIEELAATEPETKPETEPETNAETTQFVMDDMSEPDVGQESVEESDSESLGMSTMEVSVCGDAESVDGTEIVRIGAYSFEQKPCAVCSKIRESKFGYSGGEVRSFSFFESYCKKCQKKKYAEYKSRKSEVAEQLKIARANTMVKGKRNVQDMKVDELNKLKLVKQGQSNRSKAILTETLKGTVKKTSNLSLNLYIK